MLANILTVTATTRYLGPTSYGALTTAIVFVGLWTSLTELGIGSVIVRNVMSGRGSLERLVRVNAGMSLAYSLPLFALACGSGYLVYRQQGEVAQIVLIVSTSLILTTISSCFQPIFVATIRFTAVAVSDLVSRLASLALTLVLVEHKLGLLWFAAVQLVPAVAILLIQGAAASRIVDCRPVFVLEESWQLLRESLPQTAVLIIGVLYWRVDGVILSLRSTQDEVGIYGLAYTLAFTVSVLPGFFGTSTLSAMTHLYATDRERFARFVAKSVRAMAFVGMPIAIVGSICSTGIVGIVGSAGFVDRGGPTLALLLLAASTGFITGVLSQALFAAHDQIFLLRLNVANLIVNIILNVILAPVYGAVGAGIAMAMTEGVGLIIGSWRLRKLTSYRTPWPFMIKLCIPLTACSVASVLTRSNSVLLVVPLAAAVYLLSNLLLGPMTWKNIRMLAADSTDGDAPIPAAEVDPKGPR